MKPRRFQRLDPPPNGRLTAANSPNRCNATSPRTVEKYEGPEAIGMRSTSSSCVAMVAAGGKHP